MKRIYFLFMLAILCACTTAAAQAQKSMPIGKFVETNGVAGYFGGIPGHRHDNMPGYRYEPTKQYPELTYYVTSYDSVQDFVFISSIQSVTSVKKTTISVDDPEKNGVALIQYLIMGPMAMYHDKIIVEKGASMHRIWRVRRNKLVTPKTIKNIARGIY